MFEFEIDQNRVRRLLTEAFTESTHEGTTFWEEHIFVDGDATDEPFFAVTEEEPEPINEALLNLMASFENRLFDDRRLVLFYEVTPRTLRSPPWPIELAKQLTIYWQVEITVLWFDPNLENAEDQGNCHIIAVAFDDASHASGFKLQFDKASGQQVADYLAEM